MTAKFYYRTSAGDTVEITSRIDRRVPWELKETAEEGAVPMSTITVADPDMDLDLDGHRAFYVLEDESEITDNVLFGGWTWSQSVSRGEGENFEPLGRTWQLEVTDRNAFWQRRVMTGADCKRPAETDVARMAWLLSTGEAGIFDDVTTYVLGSGGTNLDKCDYRGQYLGQVVDDCSQASGRNWYTWLEETGTGREAFAWYNRDSVTARASTLFLSNDPGDWQDDELLDGTSAVWPISEDTRLARDCSRVYSGVYLAYDGGAVYRRDSATLAAFASRDFVAPSSNVKTKTKAAARAIRYLDELDNQDDRITTTVELPKAKGTMIRAGMRIPFKATHLPGYTTYQWLRVLSCTVRPAAGGERYRLTLELAPNGNGGVPFSAACNLIDVPITTAQTFPPNLSATTLSPGNVFYTRPGLPAPIVPTTGHVGGWHFPIYNTMVGLNIVDAAGDAAQNKVRIVVAGGGTLEVVLSEHSGDGHVFGVELQWGVEVDETHWSLVNQNIDTLTYEIPNDEHCYHWIEVGDDGDATGGKWAFVRAVWTPS